jgi:hypothetical protein
VSFDADFGESCASVYDYKNSKGDLSTTAVCFSFISMSVPLMQKFTSHVPPQNLGPAAKKKRLNSTKAKEHYERHSALSSEITSLSRYYLNFKHHESSKL